MLNQRPTFNITHSNWFQLLVQVDNAKSHSIQLARDNIAEIENLHNFVSAGERLQFIDSLLADNKNPFPIAQLVKGGVQSPNPTQRESNAANESLASTLLPGGSKPTVYLDETLSSGE
jgi:hypothetical protein